MSAFRILAGAGTASGLALLVASPACSVDAIGIEDCRDIEYARCEAGRACGIVSDFDECKRFYRDHCLHGLALEDEPSALSVRACVGSLKAIATCASDPARGKETALADCQNATAVTGSSGKVCDFVSSPERLFECQFLVPKAPPPPPPDAANEQTDAPTSD